MESFKVLLTSIETIAKVTVNALKEHTFKVKFDNQLKSADQVNLTAEVVKIEKFNPEVKITNLDEIPAFPEFPSFPEFPKTLSIDNLETLSPILKQLVNSQEQTTKAINKLKLAVNIPAFPTIPTPIVNVTEKNITFPELEALKGTNPEEYVPVRLTNGTEFYEALMSVSTGLKRSQTISNIDPTEVYQVSDIDDAGSTKYYGFLDKDGNWYIMKKTATEARYFKGSSEYTTSWTGRVGLDYDYFSEIF